MKVAFGAVEYNKVLLLEKSEFVRCFFNKED